MKGALDVAGPVLSCSWFKLNQDIETFNIL